MNIQRLQDCAAVLGEMSDNFMKMPSDKESASQAGLYCLLAKTYVLEFAKHLTDGMEPFDALEATARGDLKIPEEKTLLLKILTAKTTK